MVIEIGKRLHSGDIQASKEHSRSELL
jgi:hypothetical protein